MKRNTLLLGLLLSLCILLTFSTVTGGLWWQFGYQETSPQVTIDTLRGNPVPDDGYIILSEELHEVVLQGRAFSEKAPIRTVHLSLDGGETWEKITPTDGTWSYTLYLLPNTEYQIQVKSEDALERFSEESKRLQLSYYPLPSKEDVIQVLEELMTAYRNQDLHAFMTYISSEFYGGESTIRDGVISDFEVFHDVQLQFTVQRINIERDAIVVESEWTLIYQREEEDINRRKDGSTILTFTSSLLLLSMSGNPIFGTTSPFIQEIGGYEIEYSLIVRKEGEGSVEPGPGEHLFSSGTRVDLEATPDQGWFFVHWSGDITSEEKSTTILMDRDKKVTAHFQQILHSLTIRVEGLGEVRPAPGTHMIVTGEEVKLEAIPEEGWLFSYWEGEVEETENPVTSIMMDKDEEVTAWFIPMDVVEQPTFHPQPGTYGGELEIEIYSNTDGATIYYRIDGEDPDEVSGLLYEEPIIIKEDTLLKAIAVKESMLPSPITSGKYTILPTYSLTVEIVPEEAGYVETDPEKEEYEEGDEVILRAIPHDGYNFSHWQGDTYGETTTITITIDEDTSITAVFTPWERVEAPSFSPPPGSYTGSQTITISSTTPHTTIYYTTDGTEPYETNGLLYEEPVKIEKDITLKAIALKENMYPSPVTSGEYTIIPTYSLTIDIKPEDAGYVEVLPEKKAYEEGEIVELTAVPYNGFTFSNWQGDTQGDSITTSITIDEDKVITAIFHRQYTLSLSITGEGRVIAYLYQGEESKDLAEGDHLFTEGLYIELEAIPDWGWELKEWSGDGETIPGLPERTGITMDGNRSIMAEFQREQDPVADISVETLEFGPTKVYTITVNQVLHLKNAERFSIKDTSVYSVKIGERISRNSLDDRMTIFIMDIYENVLAFGEVPFEDFKGMILLERK